MKLIMENWRKFIKEAIDSSFDGEMDALRGIRPGRDMMSDPSYSSGYSSMSPGQKKINAETLYPMLKKLANREDFDPKIKSGINDLFRKTVNTIRDKGEGPILSDQELQGLLDASRNSKSIDPNSPNSFAGQVLAMLDGMQSDVDTDNDGIPDEKELAIIDRGEIPNI
jgi:hypothetical protein